MKYIKYITDKQYAYAKRRGISRNTVYYRVWVLDWPVEKAIRDRVRGERISTDKEFFGGAG